jgi:hypothetical protein
MAPRDPATPPASAELLPLPDGPVLVVLRMDDPEHYPAAAIQGLSVELERLAPGRASIVVLGPGADLTVLTDDELTAIGLTRAAPQP